MSQMSSPTPAFVLNRFKHHLNEIVAAEQLYPWLDTSEQLFVPDLPLDLLNANNINPASFVESVSWQGICQQLEAFPTAGKSRCLQVAPCSPLFTPLLELLAKSFANINFIDNNRAGLRIGDKLICHPQEIVPAADDLCLLLTRNMDACDYYEKKFGKENCLNWLRAFLEKNKQVLAPGSLGFLEKFNSSKKPILFASARPMATLNATIYQMQQDGFATFWLGNEDVKAAHQTGYATPRVADVALNDYCIGSLIDFIFLFSNMKKGMALYHYESIYLPSWDFKRVAICYAATLALIRTVKENRVAGSSARLGLYMYDAIKPAVKNYAAGEVCGRLYRAMMVEAEAIVFSSFTKEFGDFVERAVGKPLPRVHHHRYQTIPSKRRPRLKDGYHIAVITSILGDFWQPSTNSLAPHIRNIMGQGIHIHYYVANNARARMAQFQESLEQKHLFHMHTPIHNLEELANELSQYHVGWSLFDMQVFSEMVSNLTDQFSRDAMDLFTPTTLPSVVWSCAAAGLPVICNRSMSAVVRMLPPGMALPLTLSELDSLPRILDDVDWPSIDQISLEPLDISNQIYNLYRFLAPFYGD